METCSLQSPSLATPLSKSGLLEKPFGYSQTLKFPNSKKYPNARKHKFIDFRAQSSSTFTTVEAAGAVSKKADSKDDAIAFVAGATGKVGSRTVRELLKLGFRVRAGVRSAQKAESLVQSVKQMKLEGAQSVEKLEIVECDLEKPDQIGAALGDSSVVLCCIGASEKEIFDVTGPYRIDFQATKNLIDAAAVAKVNHFILVTSLGTNKFGFPAAILNLFWGVLCWKRKAEEALIASGLPYTIVRPGGMERPTDAYKETHNVTLSQEDTLFGGQVSNLQVAELMACMAKNRSLSYCKVVEVIAETTAPLTPFEQLLAKIPSQRAEPKETSPVVSAPASLRSIPSEERSAPIAMEPVQAKETEVAAVQPLSPYTAYDDLKPPSSPTPTPSTTSGSIKKSDLDTVPAASESTPLSEPASATIEEVTQADVKKTKPLSPYIFYDDLKPPTSPTPTPPTGQKDLAIVDKDSMSEPSTSDTQTSTPEMASEITETASASVPDEVPKPRPLSPFFMYDDLKPPTSPTPTPPVEKKDLTVVDAESKPSTSDSQTDTSEVTIDIAETVSVLEEVIKSRPLSPYVAYEDLKPPSSPSPTPSGPKEKPPTASTLPEDVPPLTGGNGIAETLVVTSVVETNPSQDLTHYLSPYYMYEDLKPPTTPMPSPRK